MGILAAATLGKIVKDAKGKGDGEEKKDDGKPVKGDKMKKEDEMKKEDQMKKEEKALKDMKDREWRCHDEKMGKYLCGQILKITQETSPGVFMMRLQKKASGAVGGNVVCMENQLEDVGKLRVPTQMKAFKLTKEERVELDSLFDADEIKGYVSFDEDIRLYSMHMKMAMWLLKRDFAHLPEMDEIALLDPEMLSAALYGMKADHPDTDPAAEFLRSVAQIKSIVQDAKLILCPIWGGSSDGDFHWTHLSVEKKDDGSLEVEYRDSLTGQSIGCCQHAKEILILIEMALECNKDWALPPRCNLAMQPPDSPVCGHYVLHWMKMKIHLYAGEGHANGYPDPQLWRRRIEQMQTGIVKNKGVQEMFSMIKDKIIKVMADEDAKAQAIVAAIQADVEMQAKAAEQAQMWLERSFATMGGCSKCGHLRFGSTCCNPDKILAKTQAEEEMMAKMSWDAPKENEYEKKRYLEIYTGILQARALERTSDCQPLKPSDAGGGPWKVEMWDTGAGKKNIYIYIYI